MGMHRMEQAETMTTASATFRPEEENLECKSKVAPKQRGPEALVRELSEGVGVQTKIETVDWVEERRRSTTTTTYDEHGDEERQRAKEFEMATPDASAGAAAAKRMASSRASANCAGCREPIRDKFIFSVIDLNWHQDCVQCCDCSLKLNERCYTFDGKLYCKLDYLRRFGPKCFACQELIERSELVQRIKGDQIYHLKCFNCSDCNRQLKAGEQMHLIEGKRLLCRQDFHHFISSNSSKTGNGNGNNQAKCQQQIKSETNHHHGSFYSSKLAANCLAGARVKSDGLANLSGGEEEFLEEELMIDEKQAIDEEEDDDEEDLIDDDYGDEGSQIEGIRRLLDGADCLDGNNRENDENRSTISHGNLYQNQQEAAKMIKKASGGQAVRQAGGVPSAKKKRRRRGQKGLSSPMENRIAAGRNGGQQQQQLVSQQRKLANRNGESILNGSSPTASSILAASQATPPIQISSQPVPGQHHFQQNHPTQHQEHQTNHQAANQQQQSQHKLSNSSSASTASNSSTSSSLSGRHAHHGIHSLQHSIGSGAGGSGGHKPTRVRTVLNEKQLQILRECYAHNPRPDALMKEQLVELTGLSPRVIRVWFQNKRCKDKKKTILCKQMLQHEKDGRHFAGMTVLHGVPMVASSPVQYDDHSTLSSGTPLGPNQPSGPANMLELQTASQQRQQQDQTGGQDDGRQQQYAPSSPSGLDIHGYQPPWKNLIDYAHQQQGAGTNGAEARMEAASPRYQQLIGQIHGYSASQVAPDSGQQEPQPADGQQQRAHFASPQQQAPPQTYHSDQQPAALHQMGHIQQQPAQSQVSHLHQFQR